jgi:hypothetical protein
MPYAAMTRQQYRGFQSGSFGEKDRRPLATVRFTEAWTFDETVQPLFNVPSCALFATEGDAGDLPAIVTAYSGQLSKRDASSAEAGQSLKSRQISWPEAGATTASAYRGRFRQGATVVPRFLFVVRKVEGGRLGSNPAAPLVESRRTTLEKPPWKNLAPLRGPIEADFLRDLYLGESVAPFRLLSSVLAVIPWDEKKAQLVDADAAQRSGYRHLARWLKQAEELWEKNRRSSMSLTERLDYYGNLTAQMPPASVRVLYTASGTLPAAAILSDAHAVVEHKLYWASVESEDEGRYLIATLNSEALRARVAPYQSKGQWGARDFDKLLVQAPIPKFDSNSALHRDLARAGEHAEQVAAKVPLSSEIHFIRARQRIRKALAEDGVTARIDGLVTQLLG